MNMSKESEIKYKTEEGAHAPPNQQNITKEMCNEQIEDLYKQVTIDITRPHTLLTQANLEEKMIAISDEKLKFPIRILTQEEIAVLVNNSKPSIVKQKLMDSGSNRGLTPYKISCGILYHVTQSQLLA